MCYDGGIFKVLRVDWSGLGVRKGELQSVEGLAGSREGGETE